MPGRGEAAQLSNFPPLGAALGGELDGVALRTQERADLVALRVARGTNCKDTLTTDRCKVILTDSMARYSGGPVTHRALTGPRLRNTNETDEAWTAELRYTLQCVQEIRQKCDRTELRTVRQAREAGLSWTDIATSLGVTRQAAWERWHEVDDPARAESPGA